MTSSKLLILRGLTALGMLLSGHSQGQVPSQAPNLALPGQAMKGFELYSWPAQSAWKYALLVGTNREKTAREIHAAGMTLPALKTRLRQLAPGEDIVWLHPAGFLLPSRRVQNAIGKECQLLGLHLITGK